MGVAPGQSLVLYLPTQAGDSDICLGGGIIDNLWINPYPAKIK